MGKPYWFGEDAAASSSTNQPMPDSPVFPLGVIESDASGRCPHASIPLASHIAHDDEITRGPSLQIDVSKIHHLQDLLPSKLASHRPQLNSQLPQRQPQVPTSVEQTQNHKSIRSTDELNTYLLHAHETHSTTYLTEISHERSRTQNQHNTSIDISCTIHEQESSMLRSTWSNPPDPQLHARSLPSPIYSGQTIENPPLSQAIVDTLASPERTHMEQSSHSTQEDVMTLNGSISYGITAQASDATVPGRGHMGKRRVDDGISTSTRRLCGAQEQLTVRPKGEIPNTREQLTKTASGGASSYGLGLSRDNSSFQTDVAHGPGSTQGLRRESTNGFFSNSSNFVLQQPTMIDNSHHNYIQNKGPNETLLWLKDYIMTGAEFDSSERDPPPRCHPNTRTSIIERTNNWIKDPHREKNLLWVRGAAGVGKSAIVQTVLESLPEELLGGSIFFSRPRGRNNPIQLFPSIAYQLAVRDISYRDYLTEVMLKDPRSLTKSMKKQFHILFEEPFADRKLRDGKNVLVIAVDGLDECGGSDQGAPDRVPPRGQTNESAQCAIVQLITNFILQYPSIPLIWIIASRPEKYLQVKFYTEDVSRSFLEENIPVDSTEACKDVEVFLNAEFTRIRENYPDLITQSPWPSSKDFSLISSKASGLFIFAEVVIRFVEDPNPIRQLREVLATISKVSTTKSKENPLAVLDAMYAEIFSKLPPDLLEPAKKIIGNIALLDDNSVKRSVACLCLICNVLDIPKDIALTALRPLHSVLYFPEVHDLGATRPRFYHASFRDFLEDESRSHGLSVKKYEVCDELFEGLSKLARNELPHNDSLPWPGKKSLRKLRETFQSLNEGIPNEIALSSSINLFGVSLPISEGLPLAFWQDYDFARAIRKDSYIGYKMRHLEGERIRTLKHNGILFHKTLQSLGIDHKTISKCQIQVSGSGYFIILNEELKSDLKEDTLEVQTSVCHWVEAAPKRMVRVWGRDKFRRCVVIKTSEICDRETYGSVVFIGF